MPGAAARVTPAPPARQRAALERSSEHPLAAAIVAAARERNLPLAAASEFVSVTGKGVAGAVEGRRVALGNAGLMAEAGAVLGDLAARADELRRDGATVLFVALDGKPGGLIAIADAIKATTAAALDALRADGVRIIMLTGDNATTPAPAGSSSRTSGSARAWSPSSFQRRSSGSTSAPPCCSTRARPFWSWSMRCGCYAIR